MKVVKKILKILAYVILSIITIYSVVIIFQKIVWRDKTPNICGYKNFVVLTGSMEPTINVGDIVFVKQTEDIKKEDIISFRVGNSVVTHRVIEIKKEGDKDIYITKGDANSGIDSEKTEIQDIEGKYVFKIPKVGEIFLFFQKPYGVVCLFLILVAVLFLFTRKETKDPKYMKKE